MSDPSPPDILVPSDWAKNIKSAVLHVISLAHYAMVAARQGYKYLPLIMLKHAA